jgi:Holliday junction resolvase-like predicted endonuclease
MALIDEQLVEEWLNRSNFFTIRGIKCGLGEIDLLAIRQQGDTKEFWHIEVQVSFRPVGYVGGDTNARLRNDEELKAGVAQWITKKFTGRDKVAKRNELMPDAVWKYIFVHGVVRDQRELDLMREAGVEVLPYKTVLKALRDSPNKTSSSIASNIADILKYVAE